VEPLRDRVVVELDGLEDAASGQNRTSVPVPARFPGSFLSLSFVRPRENVMR
jgi:hypothetical protein